MGSDESHFNVSVGSDGQSHKTVSTNHNFFEEKGEPNRYRTEVLPLTSLTARSNRLTKNVGTEGMEYVPVFNLKMPSGMHVIVKDVLVTTYLL